MQILESCLTNIICRDHNEVDSSFSGTNLMGKFTQSVKRIVQEVKEDGTQGGQPRDEVITINERLRCVRARLDESYKTAKRALIQLHANYNDSKAVSLMRRYALLKSMIKEVVRLETQYWALVEVPKQEKQEPVPAYVLRACATLEKTQKPGEGVKTSAKLAEEDEKRRERLDRLETLTSLQIEQENTQLTNDLYRLLKKYAGLRNIIRNLKDSFMNSKLYPIFPRYTILKEMIKAAMRDPNYMEVCHEANS